MLRGALAAALTPLRAAGEALDEDAFAPYVDFLVAGGVDGLLALGTTGEGFLLPVEQRMRAAQLYVEAAQGRLQVAVHCGAQSTWDTVELAAHAADIGADAVAVMAPPYFPLDEDGAAQPLRRRRRPAHRRRSTSTSSRRGAAIRSRSRVLERLREEAPNFRGLKVSDTPVGTVRAVPRRRARRVRRPGGFAAAGPGCRCGRRRLRACVDLSRAGRGGRSESGSTDLAPVRAALERFPFQAAAKLALAKRGVPVGPDVRRPLRMLTDAERRELEQWLESSSPVPVP